MQPLLVLLPLLAAQAAPRVTPIRLPHDGYQPVAAVDAEGAIHAVFHTGDARAGDLLYVRSGDGGKTFGAPLRVTTDATRACAQGTVRGAQLALGPDGRVHVAWNGATPTGGDAPMLYARLDASGTAFEPPRDVIAERRGLDGGGAVVAGPDGDVWVVWHAPAEPGGDEASRRVYAAHSTDGGDTFAAEEAVSPHGTGVCPCCGLAAFEDGGELAVVYRIAHRGQNRDTLLCHAGANAAGYQALDRWRVPACVMSTYSVARATDATLVAFESQGAIRYARTRPGPPPASTTAPGGSSGRKHPSIACAADGSVLLAWIAQPERDGGTLEWQVFDASDLPIGGATGARTDLPAWDRPAALALPDGSFVLLY